MKKLILSILLLCSPIISFGYEGNPEEQVASFFKDLSAGKGNEAIDRLFSSNPAFSEKLQMLTVLKQQLSMVDTLFGKSIGQENYIAEKPTPSVTRIVIVDKHEKHPIIWELYFYKPYDKWIVSQGLLNDQFGYLGTNK
jgi:hypothetical protein